MPTIDNTKLYIGKESGTNKQWARIRFDVTFDRWEIAQGVGYACDVHLFERDYALDKYYRDLNDLRKIEWEKRPKDQDKAKDEYEGLIAQFDLEPSAEPQHFDRERTWQFIAPDQGIQPEEYIALISLTPHLGAAAAWSDEVKIDVV